LLGILGILGGASTGYEFLELPKIAWPFLFVTLAVVGLWGLLSFHYRRRSDLYPSQWFLLGALFWLPWIVSVASFLLVFSNVRGVMQAVVNVWYAHNLLSLFLTPVGVAAIYYFIPKWAGRPLHSRSLAAAGFWMLAVAGGWGGMSRIAGGPIPYWMISVSVVANVFLAATAATVAVNVCQTLAAGGSKWSLGRAPVSMRFILLGTAAYAAASLLQALTGFATVAKVTLFTHLPVAVDHLLLFGFFGMVALGAAYDILPRLLGAALPSASLIRWHYLGSAIGLAVYVAALVAAGLIQGLRMNNPSVEFMSVVKSTIPFIGVATLGWIAFLLGQIAFLVNVQRAFLRLCAPACAAFCQACCPETASPAKSKGES
jgi:cytochrome c oxidase cbb3-type subunit 1